MIELHHCLNVQRKTRHSIIRGRVKYQPRERIIILQGVSVPKLKPSKALELFSTIEKDKFTLKHQWLNLNQVNDNLGCLNAINHQSFAVQRACE